MYKLCTRGNLVRTVHSFLRFGLEKAHGIIETDRWRYVLKNIYKNHQFSKNITMKFEFLYKIGQTWFKWKFSYDAYILLFHSFLKLSIFPCKQLFAPRVASSGRKHWASSYRAVTLSWIFLAKTPTKTT